MKTIKRNGQVVEFDATKIEDAVKNCILDAEGLKAPGTTVDAANNSRIHEIARRITTLVVDTLKRRDRENVHIEDIQDQVELALMREGHHQYARAYVLYREARAEARRQEQAPETVPLHMVDANGDKQPLDFGQIRARLEAITAGLEADAGAIMARFERDVFDGIEQEKVEEALAMAAKSLIEKDPDYSKVAARLLLEKIRHEACGLLGLAPETGYPEYFRAYLRRGIKQGILNPELEAFDVDTLSDMLDPGRDLEFDYLGLQTLYDRYFIHDEEGTHYELPQALFMRVAMGLSLNEVDRESIAGQVYNKLSGRDCMTSTPALFNAGCVRSQLSSCYLTTVPDDLDGIFSAIKDNAMLSKFAGGLGNDWTPVRGLGSHIKGTNGKSQGVVPFLKVANDTAVAVNQGGRRRGAACAYLETWHIDIEEFLELRKNTGDERRRTHDMNTANWIPDLFMKRVAEEGEWTLFSPDETPDLHDLSGRAFEEAYTAYEKKAKAGEIKLHKTVSAVELWRKMLGMLFETGHPWIVFKDPCNVRYTNQHQGAVHSSNLCTEITLHTSRDEIAVCNLASINLMAHLKDGEIDRDKLRDTVRVAMRAMDNVIDINYYSVPQARRSNLQHRPVGLGIMGFQDALQAMGIPYASEEAVEFADRSMELVSYFAVEASSDLAAEKGRYPSYEGSLWSQGILPIDSLAVLAEERGGYLQLDTSTILDWDALREKVKAQGMRNSNVMAIAPTATISNICGVSQSIEPAYQNLFVKSNLSGEFTVLNRQLVEVLKERGLWDDVMVNDLKYYDGCLANIERVPEDLKALFATAFEIDPRWLVEAASRRQKWIDQAQSLNLYMAEPSGKLLDNLYKLAWVRGLKSTYYLRSVGATGAEKTVSEPRAGKAGQTAGAVNHIGFKLPDAVEVCDSCQ